MNRLKLAMCNFIPDIERLRSTALSNGFSGIDWTFQIEDVPTDRFQEARLIREISRLHPLEVRYHCALKGLDLGDLDRARADRAMVAYRQVCRTIHRLDGRFMTIHVGLGREAYDGLSWQSSIDALAELVEYGSGFGICVCLENLASGWSSRPELFEKLLRKTGAGATLDIGHARVSPSIESQHYRFEDFVLPHAERIFNAHIYHEERDGRHVPPDSPADLWERLTLLQSTGCHWWVLELRQEGDLEATTAAVRTFLEADAKSCRAELPGTGSFSSVEMTASR